MIQIGIPLQIWFKEHMRDTSEQQIIFVRDNLCYLISSGMQGTIDEKKSIVTVISEHMSRSVQLPVYHFDRSDIGLEIVLRNNFYNWKLSVISDFPIVADFDGLFYTTPDPNNTDNCLSPVCFEGFPRHLVFGYYSENNFKWSAELYNDEAVWTTLFLILKSRKQIKPIQWR